MGWLRSLLGLKQAAKDDLKVVNEIYAAAVREDRKLTPEEAKQIKKLEEMHDDKIDRAKDQGWTGLG